MKARTWIFLVLAMAAAALISYRDHVGSALDLMRRHVTTAMGGEASPAEIARAAPAVVDSGVQPVTPEASAGTGATPAGASAPAPALPAKPSRVLKLSAAQARAAMLERWRRRDCDAAQRQSSPRAMNQREQDEWRWLPPDLAAGERRAVAGAAARLAADCPAPITDRAEMRRRNDEAQATLAAATAAGDLYARLELSSDRRNPAELATQARALMYDAVLSRDPEAIARLWRIEFLARRGQRAELTEQYLDVNLWPLVACDLGMDCGPGSRALDRACLEWGNGCGYPSLEALVRDRSPSWQYNLTDQRRRQIVERIRSGQIAGMFDPPPPPPDGRP